MEDKRMMEAPVQEAELNTVNGGEKRYVIDHEETVLCPFCIQKHPVGVIGGKQTVGVFIRKLYWCRNANQYFYKEGSKYYDINGEHLPIGDFRG